VARVPLLLRCDASPTLGLGHAARAVALAEEIGSRLAVEPVVLGRPTDTLRWFLELNGLPLEPLDGDGYCGAAVAGYARAGAVVVSDSYDLREDDLAAVAATGARHLVVDDFASLTRYDCDVLVNPNVGASASAYVGARHVLAGPRYALLRAAVRRAAASTRLRPAGDRLLVSLGGGLWGETERGLVEAIIDALPAARETRVVGRDLDLARGELVAAASLPEQLEWADAALLAGGVTRYEAAACGLPAALVAVVEHQELVAQRFADAGAALYLGPAERLAPAAAAESLERLLRDVDLRRRVSSAARSLVDARGASYAVDALLAG